MSTAETPLVNQPIKRRSTKAQAIKTTVLARHLIGDSKTNISNDLGITRNCVNTILAESEINDIVLQGRSRAVSLIPRSLDVIDTRLDKGSETAALAILRGTNVLQSQAQQVTTNNSFAINLLQLKQQRENAAQNALPAQIQPITAPIEQVSTPKRKPGRPKKVVDNAKS